MYPGLVTGLSQRSPPLEPGLVEQDRLPLQRRYVDDDDDDDDDDDVDDDDDDEVPLISTRPKYSGKVRSLSGVL